MALTDAESRQLRKLLLALSRREIRQDGLADPSARLASDDESSITLSVPRLLGFRV